MIKTIISINFLSHVFFSEYIFDKEWNSQVRRFWNCKSFTQVRLMTINSKNKLFVLEYLFDALVCTVQL